MGTQALARAVVTVSLAAAGAAAAQPGGADPANPDAGLVEVAREARQVIAVIDWFYIQHRACPQPSQPGELARLQADLGDGYAARRQGRFVEIRGISMRQAWLYYASPGHPQKCTLWRKLGWDPALIWRREGGSGYWTYDPGDGRPERPFTPAPE